MARACRLGGIAAVALCASVLGMASSAFAVEHHPKGEYAPFADCPLSNSATTFCTLAKTESGYFVIAKEEVPIAKTITLQGGIHIAESGAESFIGAEDGNTLSKTPQKVPGGLSGLVKCNEISNFLERIACELVFENGTTGVNATTELAASASSIAINVANLRAGTGIALTLPIKVHLENTFLGSSCYIGSNAHPIDIELTTGTTSPPPPNKPITGSPGTEKFNESFTIITAANNSLVNNSFAAPGSEGCGGIFSFLIDPIVNSKLGLPSASGHNTAVLKGTLQLAEPEAVKASE
jgi:hypothetical protein